MKRNLLAKAIVAVIALALLSYGLMQMQSDPTLRDLQRIGIAALEGGGPKPREDQYIQVTDGYLMPYYMINYTHSRKRGDSAHVFVPVGSLAMQEKAFRDEKIHPVVWVRLSQDFGTKEAADKAMQSPTRYQRPYPVSGVARELEGSVREEMQKVAGLQITDPVALHEGSTPLSLGRGAEMAFAGGTLLLVVALWAWGDIAGEAWAKRLEVSGAAVFVGTSAQLITALVGAVVLVLAVGEGVNQWVESRSVSPVGVGVALAGLAMVGFGLWRNRAAVVVGADRLYLVRNGSREKLMFADVQGLLVDERKVKGVLVAKYTLLTAGKPFKVGSSWFRGGVDDARGLGALLRERVTQKLAPALQARIAGGERVSFGPLFVGHDGIGKGKATERADVLTWQDIGSATLKNGQLKIKQKGKMFGWGSFAVSKIVNFDLLMHMLQGKVA